MISEKYKKAIEILTNLQFFVFSFKVSNIKVVKKVLHYFYIMVCNYDHTFSDCFLTHKFINQNVHMKQSDFKFQWSVFIFVNKDF